MNLLIVDNYDSFTFNLYQLAAEVFETLPVVVPNNHSFEEIAEQNFDAVIISPGPGTPAREADFGISRNVICEMDAPVLGVCLGHQGICHLSGGSVVHAPQPMHGRENRIYHTGTGLFEGIPDPFTVVRYHSLVVRQPLPDCLEKTAWTEDGLVMGVAHRSRPIWGVQFHPESICSTFGRQIMQNFRRLASNYGSARPVTCPLPAGAPRPANGNRFTRPVTPMRMFVRKMEATETAERIFERAFRQEPYAFWLDSSLTREPDARFSFLGGYASSEDFECIRYYAHHRRLNIQRGKIQELVASDLFTYLNHRLASVCVEDADLPFDFHGGFVGYFGYELKALCGARAAHRSPYPDCLAILADRFVAIDHMANEMYLVFTGKAEAESEASAWFDKMELAIATPRPRRPGSEAEGRREVMRFVPAHPENQYLDSIEHCLEAIKDGETYEVCLTNQLSATTQIDAFEYYKKLRLRNPAPYSSFLQFPELSVASSSPERFLKIERDGVVETKPIKGTIRRGLDETEDALLKRSLSEDEKSRSENLMIVDLLRNDLGRVCSVGSVHVPKLMHVETYATVHQLVTTIRGRLGTSQTSVDCLRAAFPGGSMTGAPKLRTMEIIDSLEGSARGVYSGSIGFLSFNGRADLNIVIRTAVFARNKVTIGVGGAIIALSDPHEEWAEILLKAKALLSTFEALNQTVLLMNHPLEMYGKTIDLSKRVG